MFLRQHREQRGLTIDDLWRTTKINKSTLRALEATDVLHLPAPIYTRGFVKAYAREVGLNPDATADDYLRRIEALRSDDVARAPGEVQSISERRPDSSSAETRDLLAGNQGRRFGRFTFALAAVGLVVYIASFYRGTDEASSTENIEPSDYAGYAAGDAVRATADDTHADVSTAALTDEQPLRVEFVTQGECWLAARVNGERVFAKLLQPGERQILDVGDEIVLRVGEPGALSFSINGQSGRPLGPAGQPITVRITKDNFREFLSS